MSLEARVVVVDDDPGQREHLAGFLRDLGAEVREAATGESAFASVTGDHPDVVLTDVRMPGMDGTELLRRIKEINPEVEVILVTAYGTVAHAVACLKAGAADYLLKPLDLDEVEHVIRRAVERRHLLRENRDLKRRLGEVESVPGIITAGGGMTEVLSTVARVAPTPVSVLVLGESGTGKELVARAIHSASGRKDGPFIAVSATALSPTLLESELFGHERGAFTGADRARVGRFEAASGGTIFLDEIGDLPLEIQVKLLRVLQERTMERVGSARPVPIDVRVISATHNDLAAGVKKGSFREDLFYRLAVVCIEIPPLRRRRGDIPLLVDHFIRKHAKAGGRARRVSREAMDLLVRYDYPGNVRELENIVQRALVLAREEMVSREDLPGAVREADPASEIAAGAPRTLREKVEALERAAIREALQAHGGNQSRAAAALGLSERALRYKLARCRMTGREASSPAAEASRGRTRR